MTDVPVSDVVTLLSPSLGTGAATAAVREAMQELGVSGERLSPQVALSVLSRLATRAGLVGVTARLGRTRLESRLRRGASSRPDPAPDDPPPSVRRVNPTDVAGMLAPSVGVEKARAAVAEALTALSLPSIATSADALRVLEHLSEGKGPVAVTARFAKVRLHLTR